MLKISEIIPATGGKITSGLKNPRIKGFSIDSRKIKKGDLFIAIKGNKFDGHNFISEVIKRGAVCIIKDSRHKVIDTGSATIIKVKDTQIALGRLAKYMRIKSKLPVIAVTGSAGKTTSKEMISWVLSKKFKVLHNEGTKNNQIGLPLTLLKLKKEHNLAVLELGSNHFGEIGYLAGITQANIGVITNIGSAHLEHFKDLEGVFKEKSSCIKNLINPAIAVLNNDDVLLNNKFLRSSKKNYFSYGIRKPSDFRASRIKQLKNGLEFLVNEKYRFRLNTLGRSNIYNALSAIALARIFGMEYKQIVQRLASFEFPQGRLKLIEFNQVKFIDDTYNANPLSLRAALETIKNLPIKGRKIFVMGDMLELGEKKEKFHSQAGKEIAEICDIFISVGDLSRLAASVAREAGLGSENIFSCANSNEARELLFKRILPKKDDIVLIKGSRSMKMEEIFVIPSTLSTTRNI